MIAVVYAVLFSVATAVLVIGLSIRLWVYATTPAPLKIPTTPAPITQTGVAFRLFREFAFFESLFKANKWIWVFGYVFHVALALVLLRHMRYFIDPVWSVVVIAQPFGIYAGFAMVAGLLALWARRVVVPRIRYISEPADHLMLALLVAIGVSGLMMKFVVHTDIIAVKQFFRGLMGFTLNPLPADPLLLIHLGLVAALMIIFPYSKLLHGPALFFSPTRNQVDNPREKRHIVAWAANLPRRVGPAATADGGPVASAAKDGR